jgi:hypothetical protein
MISYKRVRACSYFMQCHLYCAFCFTILLDTDTDTDTQTHRHTQTHEIPHLHAAIEVILRTQQQTQTHTDTRTHGHTKQHEIPHRDAARASFSSCFFLRPTGSMRASSSSNPSYDISPSSHPPAPLPPPRAAAAAELDAAVDANDSPVHLVV